MESTGVVYKMVFISSISKEIDKMTYVGSTVNFNQRCKCHVSYLNRDTVIPLYQYMRLKGYNFVDNVEFHVLERLPATYTKHERLERERYHMMTVEKTNLLNFIRPLEAIIKCPHGKPKRSHCRACNGSSICRHNRVYSVCKDCMGGSICPHLREKAVCVPCRGGSICPHLRRRSKCTLCGQGGGICEHKKLRVICKACRGSGRCAAHNKITQECKTCSPHNFCVEHNCSKKSKLHKDCTFPPRSVKEAESDKPVSSADIPACSEPGTRKDKPVSSTDLSTDCAPTDSPVCEPAITHSA
jgi:hypothetical protein